MKRISILMALLPAFWLVACSESDSAGDIGTGGSMARFTIYDHYLYAVDYENLFTFDIVDSTDIQKLGTKYLGFGIETIFPMGDQLFIGAQNGMYIFDVSNPSVPVKRSFTPHFVSYDPVVVQDKYAYVTLRTGADGWGWANLLQVYDISKADEPELLAEYEMTNPKGIGILDNRLFLCDADLLKVFEVTNGSQINQIQSFDLNGIDVIPTDERLYVLAEDGFYQYNYDGNELTFLSKIAMEVDNEK